MKILVVDDDQAIRETFELTLKELGHEPIVVESGEAAQDILRYVTDIKVILTDFNMGSGMNGCDLMESTKKTHPHIYMVMMTGFSSLNGAVEAGNCGAFAYLPKPIELKNLEETLKKISDVEVIKLENRTLKNTVDIIQESSRLKTYNDKMQRVINLCEKIAPNDSTVLITGRSGTGKSMLAKIIHDQSPRRNKPFVTVTCATLSENLLESEIFGHARGAFTGAIKEKKGRFEVADGGTIFLDEIAEISPNLQTKLLRFLQDREFERVGDIKTIKVNIRLVAATNKNLSEEVKAGRFREDLYYRLNVIDVHVPTLKERAEDIEHLANTYLAKAFIINGREPKPLSPDAIRVLKAHDWPGNVRELENALQRAAILCAGDSVEAHDLPNGIYNNVSSEDPQSEDVTNHMTESDVNSLEDMEKNHIKRVLDSSRTIEEASSILGINSSTLWRKRKRYGLT
jgi:DNA-binding NtrC family response regulator